MGRDLTHMLNQTNDMQEKKRVYDLSFILFELEILVSEKFLFSLKVDPCCSSNVRTPLLSPPIRSLFLFAPRNPQLPGGVENRTCSDEAVLAFDFFCF